MKRYARSLALLVVLVFPVTGFAAEPVPQAQTPTAPPPVQTSVPMPTQPHTPTSPKQNNPTPPAALKANTVPTGSVPHGSAVIKPGTVIVPPGAVPPPPPGRGATRRAGAVDRCNGQQAACTNRCNNRTMGQARNLCYNQCNGQFVHCTARANTLP